MSNFIEEHTIIVSAWLPGGGIEKVIQNLIIDDLPFKNIKILVLSKDLKFNWYKSINNKIKFVDCFSSKDKSIIKLFINLLKSYFKVREEINTYKPHNILFTHSFLMPLFFFLNPKSKVLFWPHNNLLTDFNPIKFKIKKLTYKIFKSRINGILCVSESILNEANLIGFDHAKLTYNPIGENFNNQFVFSPSSNKLVHIGFLDERKNTSYIIKALSLSSNKDLTLDVIGEGHLMESLKNQVSELGMNNRVFFKGFLDLSKELISCSALIMASKTEGFSMVISDALKSGIPLILPENLDISNFINSDKRGKVFNLNNLNSLRLSLNLIDFKEIDSNEIKNEYINMYGKIAYSKRISSFINSL